MNNAISHAAADATQSAAMSFEQWVEAYKPIKNTFNELAPYDGTMFETFGNELAHVRAADENTVWTLVTGDDDELVVSNGFHYVNRVGYLVTEVPFAEKPGMEFLEIVVDDGESPAYPKADWQQEVANGYTKLGYLDWVFHKEECDALGDSAQAPHMTVEPGEVGESLNVGGM